MILRLPHVDDTRTSPGWLDTFLQVAFSAWGIFVSDAKGFIMSGWVKLHRGFLRWEWFDDPNMIKLFIYLLLSANHEDKKWRGNVVKRGQIITGLKSLSTSTKLSIQTVRTCLSRLHETGEIDKQSNNHFSVITICNYEKYQEVPETINKQANKPATNHQQTTNNKQELKNEKNDKKEPLKPMLPDWISDDSWQAFLEMRKKIKAAPTGRAIELLIKKLGDLRSEGYDPNEVINQSTMNGWKGFFPVKETANTPAKKSKQSLAIEQLLKGTSYDPSRMDRRSDIGPSRTIDITTSRLLSGGKS